MTEKELRSVLMDIISMIEDGDIENDVSEMMRLRKLFGLSPNICYRYGGDKIIITIYKGEYSQPYFQVLLRDLEKGHTIYKEIIKISFGGKKLETKVDLKQLKTDIRQLFNQG